jgi:V-type H+-transporting ATPase subunit a
LTQASILKKLKRYSNQLITCQKGFLIGQAEKSEVRLKPLETDLSFARARSYQELTEIESQLGLHESRILQMNQSKETLNKRYLELTELKHVLKETASFFDEVSKSNF